MQVPEAHGPLDFAAFPFQVEMYDEHGAHDREQVWMKSTQCGISTLAIRWALYHADVHGRIGLYCFPTERELGDFSRQRIRPVIRASAHLQSRMTADAVDNVAQKEIGAGWVYFRGTNKPIDSIPADAVVFDEYDSCDATNIVDSEYRVSGPRSAGLLRRVGVPTFPGMGIAEAYERSDQRVWTVRCSACNEHNRLRGMEAFAMNVDQETCTVVCRRCRRPIEVRDGEWVATFPDRDVRGYAVPKLIVPGARLDAVVARSRRTRPDQQQAFHNRDLGKPWAPSENRLGIEQVRACVDDDLRPLASLTSSRLVTMGVDVASARALNVVIEEAVDDRRGRRVFVGEIEDRAGKSAFERLDELMHAYGVHMACVDHMPEKRSAEAFAARFPGRVYLVGYFNPAPGNRHEVQAWNVDDAAAFVSVWRTYAIDVALERFRDGRVLLPPLELLPADYPAHLGALVRQAEPLANGTVRLGYAKTGADDYAHAEVYNMVAGELFWRCRGIEIATTPLQITGDNYDGYTFGAENEYGEPEYRPPSPY